MGTPGIAGQTAPPGAASPPRQETRAKRSVMARFRLQVTTPVCVLLFIWAASTVATLAGVFGNPWLIAALGLIIVGVAVARTSSFVRQMAAETSDLAAAAQRIADVRLPSELEALRADSQPGEPAPLAGAPLIGVPPTGPEVPDSASAEIGEVSAAIADLHQAALSAAAAEAGLRNGLRQVLVSLSRRNQSLIHRQLRIIDRLENRASGSAELGELFTLDHLTTRMRRHAESLTVLAGEAPGRSWGAPVPVVDVMRAAAAEVEDYQRVLVRSDSDQSVTAPAVTDMIHLLAELIENATLFSPSSTKVEVRAESVANGFVIEIEDRGLGIPADQLRELNTRLAGAPDEELADADRLGLFVAARLAARHGVQVSLNPSAYRGTKAVVVLPAGLVVAGQRQDRRLTGEQAAIGADRADRLDLRAPGILALAGSEKARRADPVTAGPSVFTPSLESLSSRETFSSRENPPYGTPETPYETGENPPYESALPESPPREGALRGNPPYERPARENPPYGIRENSPCEGSSPENSPYESRGNSPYESPSRENSPYGTRETPYGAGENPSYESALLESPSREGALRGNSPYESLPGENPRYGAGENPPFDGSSPENSPHESSSQGSVPRESSARERLPRRERYPDDGPPARDPLPARDALPGRDTPSGRDTPPGHDPLSVPGALPRREQVTSRGGFSLADGIRGAGGFSPPPPPAGGDWFTARRTSPTDTSPSDTGPTDTGPTDIGPRDPGLGDTVFSTDTGSSTDIKFPNATRFSKDTKFPSNTRFSRATKFSSDTGVSRDTKLPGATKSPGYTEFPVSNEPPDGTEPPDGLGHAHSARFPGVAEFPGSTELSGSTGLSDSTGSTYSTGSTGNTDSAGVPGSAPGPAKPELPRRVRSRGARPAARQAAPDSPVPDQARSLASSLQNSWRRSQRDDPRPGSANEEES